MVVEEGTSAVAGYANAALNISIIIITVVIVAAFVGLILWMLLKWKKYQEFNVNIFTRDGAGNLVQKKDSAGIFVDSRTKNKRLFLRKNNVGLDPDAVPFIQSEGGKKTIYLYQTGLKNFHFIKVGLRDPGVTLTVGEEDVNWALNAYDRQKKIFQKNLFMELLPFISLVFVCVIILIIFIYFFKDFGVLKDMAEALKAAATEIAHASSGTAILD